MKKTRYKRNVFRVFAAIACAFMFIIMGIWQPSAAKTPTESAVVTAAAESVSSLPASTKADIVDANFRFDKGAAVNMKSLSEDLNVSPLRALRWTLRLENEDMLSFVDHTYDQAIGIFTLYREEGDRIYPLYRMMYFYAYGVYGIAHKHIYGDDGIRSYQGQVRLRPLQNIADVVATSKEEILGDYDASSMQSLVNMVHLASFFKDLDYELDFVMRRDECGAGQPLLFDVNQSGEPVAYIIAEVNSTDCQYFIDFEYEYKDFERIKEAKVPWKDDKWIYEETSGHISSHTRSVFSVLNAMDNAGDLGILPDDLIDEARDILTVGRDHKTVTIGYLEQIAKTPYARKKTAQITVPVHDDVIYHDDAAAQLGFNFNLMTTIVKHFEYDEMDGIYNAVYYTDALLVARTIDGNSMINEDMFFDLNQSYEEYFLPYVCDDIMYAGAYDWFFSKIVSENRSKDPIFETIQPADLYGYFGYLLTPQTKGWNDLWGDILNKNDTNFAGIVSHFEYQKQVSGQKYRSLLKDYGYDFLARAWEAIAGTFETDYVKHYFLVLDPTAEKSGVMENGSTDIDNVDGLFANAAKDTLTDLGHELADIAKGVGNATKPFVVALGIIFGLFTLFIIVALGVKIWNTMNGAKAYAGGAPKPKKRTSSKKRKRK